MDMFRAVPHHQVVSLRAVVMYFFCCHISSVYLVYLIYLVYLGFLPSGNLLSFLLRVFFFSLFFLFPLFPLFRLANIIFILAQSFRSLVFEPDLSLLSRWSHS